MTEKGGGLVKKLLFPGFTDAGSNDTFRATDSNSMEDVTTQSDATTAIHDNRTMSKPQQHEVQYDGDRVGGYAPSASTVLPRAAANGVLHQTESINILRRETDPFDNSDRIGEPSFSSSSRTARLFPSTDPSSSSVESNNHAVGPASPPPMVRRAPPNRTISTRAFVGSSRLSPRTTMPFPSTSPRIRPGEPIIDLQQPKANVNTQQANQEEPTNQSIQQSEQNFVEKEQSSEETDQNSEKAEPSFEQGDRKEQSMSPTDQNNLDQSSMALTAASSGVVSSVLGYHFLDQTTEEQDEGDERSTPITSNVTKQNDSDDTFESSDNNTQPLTLETLMEMESHQDNNNTDGMSDINSNVSEYGTVIEAPGRLAEVQAMADNIESSRDSTDKGQSGPLTPMTEAEEDSHHAMSSRSYECAEEELESVALASEVAGLALPTLDSRIDARSRHDLGVAPKPLMYTSRPFKESMHHSRHDRKEMRRGIFLDKDGNDEDDRHDRKEIKYESFPEKEANPPNTSASAMVSAAIRRLGSGVGHLGLSQPLKSPIPTPTPGTLAPPSTPRPNYLRSRSGDAFSASFMLRSPGSSARFMSDHSNRSSSTSQRPNPLLSPRYRSFGSTQRQQPGTLRHATSLASPLRFARGCFSFDTSMDDYSFPEPIPESPSPQSPSSVGEERSSHQFSRRRRRSWDAGSSVLASPGQEGPFSSEEYRTFRMGLNQPKSSSSAFRSGPAGGDGSRVLHGPQRGNRELDPGTHEMSTPSRGIKMNGFFSPAIVHTHDTMPLRTPNRIEIEREDAIDILACLVERSAEFDREKGEISIENSITNATIGDGDDTATIDSIVSSDDETDSKEKPDTEEDRSSTLAESGGQIDSPPSLQSRKMLDEREDGSIQSESGFSDLTQAVRLLRDISERHQQDEEDIDHETRMRAIDELLRSHTYAAEMKRATTSASAWLRSIDREEMPEEGNGVAPAGSRVVDESSATLRKDGGQLEKDASTTSKPSGEEIDVLAMKAMLHAAETKAKEKEEAVRRLNEELSHCKAEIGRLKSSSRAEHLFTSPNRSILDDNDDDSTTSSEDVSKVGGDARALERIADDASPILEQSGEPSEGYASFEASFIRSETADDHVVQEEKDRWEALAEAKKEIVILKASLGEANNVIRKLHTKSRDETQHDGEEQIENLDDLLVKIENSELGKELDEYKEAVKKAYEAESQTASSVEEGEQSRASRDTSVADTTASSPDKRTINVRMLDGENFVTEWDELTPPLPPPPDHGLRSPIVKDLLEQWTSDKSMHDSLLSWMDRVLNGGDPRGIPPLTISSLNHQVRDGFSMHVLPLLLRRSDVHVEVKTRAHRTTTYDMAITVSSSVPRNGAGNGDDLSQASSNSNAHGAQRTTKKHMMAYKSSQGDNPVVEESMEVDEGRRPNAAGRMPDYLPAGSFSRSSENGSESGAHSAITTQITNSSRMRAADGRMPPRPVTTARGIEVPFDSDSDQFVSHGSTSLLMGDELSVGSSISRGSSQRSSKEQHPGLMSTIGGALGLLSRRKPTSTPPSPLPGSSYDDESWNDAGSAKAMHSPRGRLPVHEDLPSFLRPPPSPGAGSKFHRNHADETQPYHRVVSAPPGRIGVTFVQYRGHAVVSDVARDSPLSGWVFQSDILIAIDEVPVSGMRVRDIVNILTARKDRQRALRVISSHAMNEALNASAVSEINVGG